MINGVKTEFKAVASESTPSVDENPQQLDFYPTDDGGYYVAVGKAKYLSHIVIPSTYRGAPVVGIAKLGFNECTNLISISIPDSVTSIGMNAFTNCSSLASVTIGNGVTSIGDWAFSNCSSFTSVTIPDSVTSIGNYAFTNCSSLTSVTIGNGVTSIGSSVFEGCSSLTSVTIGNGVTSIGQLAFSGCSSLKTINYRGTEAEWAAIEKDDAEIPSGCTIVYNYTDATPDEGENEGSGGNTGSGNQGGITLPFLPAG